MSESANETWLRNFLDDYESGRSTYNNLLACADDLQSLACKLGRIRQEVERRRHTDDSSILDEITTLLSSAVVERPATLNEVAEKLFTCPKCQEPMICGPTKWELACQCRV